LKKYYEAEQEKLRQFYNEHSEFYSYYRREATYLDHKIFVRNSYDLKMKLSFGFYNFDKSFTTSHDHMIARFMANQQMDKYLKKQLEALSENTNGKTLSPLVWSASKVGLIELVYGLYQMRCFNGGNIELSEVVKFVERSLDTDLKSGTGNRVLQSFCIWSVIISVSTLRTLKVNNLNWKTLNGVQSIEVFFSFY
jgi:hypothetical protein